MNIYIVLLLALIVMNVILKRVRNGNRLLVPIMFFLLFIVSSLRAEHIGADHLTYIGVYKRLGQYGFGKFFVNEPFYAWLNVLAYFFTDNYIGLSIAVNCVIFFSLYIYFNRYVKDEFKFIVVYIFMLNPYMYIQSTFNILRQGCAMGILLFSIPYLIEKKWMKFALMVICAAQFHNISYVFLLLIGIRVISWNRKKIGTILLSATVVNLFMRNTNFLRGITRILGYEGYLTYRDSMFNFKFYVLVIFLIVSFFLIYYERLYTNEEEKVLIDIYLISLSLLPVFILNAQLYRVYIVLAVISLPAVPYILNAFRLKTYNKEFFFLKAGYYSYYMFMACIFFARMIMTHNTAYVPFKFFWQI